MEYFIKGAEEAGHNVELIFLMLGVKYGSASNASLLGNLEILTTTLIALLMLKIYGRKIVGQCGNDCCGKYFFII